MTNIEFDKKLTCGPEFVAVRIVDNGEDIKIGSIWLPQQAEQNNRLALALVEDVGSKAKEEYGIEVGEYVMIDRLSTFAHTAPVAALKYNNIICKTNKDMTEFYPLKNMLFVEPDAKDSVVKVNSIYVPSTYSDRLHIGTISKMNCDESLKLPFKIGDRVLLSKGADYVRIGQAELYIYKHDMIVATIED